MSLRQAEVDNRALEQRQIDKVRAEALRERRAFERRLRQGTATVEELERVVWSQRATIELLEERTRALVARVTELIEGPVRCAE